MLTVEPSELFEADRLQPVEIEYFSEHVKTMHENRDKRFEREYQVSDDIYIVKVRRGSAAFL